MGSIRSWLGSILSLVTFFVVRRFTHGFALPTFVVIVFACVYAWTFVLRVPELRKELGPQATAPPPVVCTGQQPLTAPKEAPPARTVDSQGAGAAARTPAQATAAPSIASVDSEATLREDAPSLTASREAEFSPEQEACANQAPQVREELTEEADDAREVRPAADSNDDEQPPRDDADTAGSSSRFWKREEHDGSQASDDESCDEEERQRREEEQFMDPARAQDLRLQGNDFFKAGQFHDAREAYAEAIFMTPKSDAKDRAVLFCNRAACFQKLLRWDEVISDCRQAIELDAEYVKAYCRRSAAYEAQSKWHDAHEDLKKAVEFDSSLKSKEYKHMAFLEKRAAEQFDKDKDEMMGKLKELGNTVLGKFGMSVDNFKMEQDPNTGSYSVKYSN